MDKENMRRYLFEALRSPIVIFALAFAVLAIMLAPFFASANASHWGG